MGARILVTGGNGFVGRHLRAVLSAQPVPPVFCPLQPDVTDPRAVEACIADFAPDACVHLAAISTIGGARHDPMRAWRVNLDGTLFLGQAILRHAPRCRLLFASTSEAYGTSFQSGTALDEQAPLAPANSYAATKAAADLALGAMARDGLRVARLRPFNHTGPGQGTGFVVPAFARQVARIALSLQDPVIQVGNLDAERDLMDVRDVCRAYASCLAPDREIPPGTILNLCSGRTRSIRSVLDDLMRLAGVTARIEIDPDRLRPSDIPRAAGTAARARAMLDWAPEIPWERTLADMLEDWTSRLSADPAA